MELFFIDFLERLDDLFSQLQAAVDGLSQDAVDWIPGPEMNSISVLASHTAGAARYWIGDVALRDSSERVRQTEFESREVSSIVLQANLEEVRLYIHSGIASLTMADLGELRTSPSHKKEFTVAFALLHTLEHTGVHVGHIQITRQLLDQGKNKE